MRREQRFADGRAEFIDVGIGLVAADLEKELARQ
jgi:hypothetical protein